MTIIQYIAQKSRLWVAALLLLALLSIPAFGEEANSADTSDSDWIDTLHNFAFTRMQGHITRTDKLFASADEEMIAITNSTFELGLDITFKDDNGFEVDADPKFDADLNLPNLQNRWKIFITSIGPDELLDADSLTDDDQELFAGLRKIFQQTDLSLFDASVGVKLRWPPDPYAKIEYSRIFTFGQWRVLPRQKVYWKNSDGFGETTALRIDYWFTDRWISRLDGYLSHSEVSRGWELEQSIALGYIIQGDENNLEHILACRLTGFGHYEDHHGQMDRYKFGFMYRRPFFRKWMFIKFMPALEMLIDKEYLEEDEEERYIPSFEIGLDIFFSDKN